jgi:hypothetical protein
MDSRYYMDEFEDFLRDKTDEYRMYPSDQAWQSIHQRLHPKPRWPKYVLALLLLGSTIAITTVLQRDFDSTSEAAGIQRNSTVLTEPIPGTEGTPVLSQGKSILPATPTSNYVRQKSTATRVTPLLAQVETGNSQAESGAEEMNPVAALEQKSSWQVTEIAEEDRPSLEEVEAEYPKRMLSPRMIDKSETRVNPENVAVGFKSNGRISWTLYFSPNVSYRNLKGEAGQPGYAFTGLPYTANPLPATHVEDAVNHRYSTGASLGASLGYKLGSSFSFTAGMMFNYSRYEIKAFSYSAERVSYGANINNIGGSPQVMSYFRNNNGYAPIWLQNEYLQIAMPVGMQWHIFPKGKIQWTVGANLQPTYNLMSDAYLVSADFKNYAQEQSLMRKFNVAAGAETFLSYNLGSLQLQAGPQIRYQLLSSYKNYPIKEYILDAGIKVGITKTLK